MCLFILQIVPISPCALVPFLSAQAGFHPKRNQARGKLATLRPLRFQDLTSDVRYELGRRYPECKEEVMSLPFPFGNLPFIGSADLKCLAYLSWLNV